MNSGRNHLLLNNHNNNNSNGATDDDPRLLVSVDDHSLQPTSVGNGWTTSSKDHVFLNESFDFVPTITDPTQSLSNGVSGPVEGTLIDLVDDSSSSTPQHESTTVTSGNTINRNPSPEKNLIEGVSSLVILDSGEPPEEQPLISTTTTTTQEVSNHQKRSYNNRRHHSSDHSDGDEDILCMYKSSSAADKQRLLIATEHHPSQSLDDGMDRESEPLIAYSSRGRLGSTDVNVTVSGKCNNELNIHELGKSRLLLLARLTVIAGKGKLNVTLTSHYRLLSLVVKVLLIGF